MAQTQQKKETNTTTNTIKNTIKKETATQRKKRNRARANIKDSKETIYDVAFKNALATFHVLDVEMARKITTFNTRSLSQKRLKLYLDADYIKKTNIVIGNTVHEVLVLTDYGARQIKKLDNRCKDTVYKSRSIEHDYAQADYIFNKQKEFSIQEIRDYYKSEIELEKANITALESRCDGAFIFDDDRQDVYIETVTQHYKQDMKQAKSNYANNRGGRYIEYNITL